MKPQESYEEEISLVDILKFFIRNSRIIIVATIICGITGCIVSIITSSISVTYRAESAIIVLGTKSDVTLESKTGFLGIKEIADIYPPRLEDRKRTIVELIKSPLIISQVLDHARNTGFYEDDKSLAVEDFVSHKSKILEVVQKGELVKIIVKLPKRELAKFIADEIAKSVVDFARKELYIDLSEEQKEKLVKIAYYSILPNKPERTISKKVTVVMALIVGVIVGILTAMIREAYLKVRQEL